MELEKLLLRKVGDAVARFKMIRDGDRVAVALSGGKDSLTLLEALGLLQKRAPVDFTVCAFTVEQGKFQRPIEPLGEYLKQRGIPIPDKPLGAKKLREMLLKKGFDPNSNEFSQGIIAMREE